MKIADIALAERVEAWARRLPELGIAHWRIERVTMTDTMPDSPNAKASVQVSTDYDSFTIYFRNGWLEECSATELDEVIVHELMHVAMRNLDHVAEGVESWMPEKTYDDWAEAFNHEREGHVDRLARLIVRLHKRRPPRFGG